MSSHGSQYKPTIVHYGLFFFLVASIGISFHYFVTPLIIRSFLLSQFHPEDEKETLVQFSNGVIGTVKYENDKSTGERFMNEVREENGQKIKTPVPLRRTKGDFIYYADVPARGEFLNKEYIFDFVTSAAREEKVSVQQGEDEEGKPRLVQVEKDGYSKKPGEWYVKCPKLGEEAIMLESWGFSILAIDVGLIFGMIVTMMLPPSIGFISQKFEREMANTKTKIRLNTGFNKETVEIIALRDSDFEKFYNDNPNFIKQIFAKVWARTQPDHEIAAVKQQGSSMANVMAAFRNAFDAEVQVGGILGFRNETLYGRIQESYSEAVMTEIENLKAAQDWQKARWKIMPALRLYMAHHFTERYSNNVTGFAYGGAAILIIVVGIRGLKFIPAARPSVMLWAILLEFTLLALMAVSLFYTEEEERMDKMLKKMEDSGKSQLSSLKGMAEDMTRVAAGLGEEGLGVAMKQMSADMNKIAKTLADDMMADAIRARVEEAVERHLANEEDIKNAVKDALPDVIINALRNGGSPTKQIEEPSSNEIDIDAILAASGRE
jgi:uncharacterized membrane-anchored protein YhcB (DUF1043 family)